MNGSVMELNGSEWNVREVTGRDGTCHVKFHYMPQVQVQAHDPRIQTKLNPGQSINNMTHSESVNKKCVIRNKFVPDAETTLKQHPMAPHFQEWKYIKYVSLARIDVVSNHFFILLDIYIIVH
jgi:hypothetical protein